MHLNRMKAAVLSEYNHIAWTDREKPACKPGEVLVRVRFGCICGTDLHIHKGEFHPRTSLPLVPGHEFGGVIEETGEGVTGWSAGEKVTVDPIIWCGTCPACLKGHYPACTNLKLIGIDSDGGFAEYISVPASMLYRVPSRIPDEHVALVEILSIGCHAKNRARVKEGETVVIWGSGKVGLSILEAVRTVTGNTVFMVDILDRRLESGASHYDRVIPVNALREDPVERIRQETGGRGVDVAFEAVGHAHEISGRVNPVQGCVRSISGGGRVCVLGLASDPSPVIFRELIWKEGTIITSRVSHGEFAEVIGLLEKGLLKPEALISGKMHGSRAQEAFELLDREPENNIKILLEFSR